jgi:predicted nucleic acid-binding protein
MIVVADASPIRYLARIGAIDVLAPLYQSVILPQTVERELQHNNTPAAVRTWIAQPPAWCEVRPDPPADPTLAFLDPGERAAITLAIAINADGLLIDDHDGREEAKHRRLHITGTLGVLGTAHLAGLVNFETALEQLRHTNFYISDAVVDGLRQRLARAGSNR